MKTVILNHEVKDYSVWRKVFDEDEVNRSKAGFKISGVFQSADNPNKLTVMGEVPSIEALNVFMSDPKLKAAMEKGGVIGMPEIRVLNRT